MQQYLNLSHKTTSCGYGVVLLFDEMKKKRRLLHAKKEPHRRRVLTRFRN